MTLSTKAEKEITHLTGVLEGKGFICTIPIKKLYNYEFHAQKNGIKNKVLIYFGKKGLKTVIQGDPNSKEYGEVKEIVSGNYSFSFSQHSKEDYINYIGTDETGKGDYFGPLVAAGFHYDISFETKLKTIGVKDSKELSDSKVYEIALHIMSSYPKNYSVVVINPKKYNELYERFQNINEILNWAHSKAVENLSKSEKPSVVITDKFSNKPLKISHTSLLVDTEFVQIPRAESYLGVAAASIIARHSMNRWFKKMENEGYKFPKGSSNEVKLAAKRLVNKHGKDFLRLYAKFHFKITNQILSEH